MSERAITPSTVPPSGSARSAAASNRVRFSLLCEGQEVLLPLGRLVMGRGSRCHVVVDDLLASREHARLTVTANTIVVQDLNSTNGLYVNERRIVSPTALRDGDRIVIGTQELIIRALAMQPKAAEPHPFDAGDPALVMPSPKPPSTPFFDLDEPGMRSPVPAPSEEDAPTEKAAVIATLGRLADRMLTVGRFDAAERVLRGQMDELLEGARDAQPVPDDVLEVATAYALKLGETIRKPSWVDYAVELHMIVKRPLSNEAITRLAALLDTLEGVDGEMVFFYQQVIRSVRDTLPQAERESCDRILALRLPNVG